MKNYFCLLLFILLPFRSFAGGEGEKDWQKVTNKLYSFKVPSDWNPIYNEQSGEIPGERDAKSIGYHLYYLTWITPFKNMKDDADKLIMLFIESYQRLDKKQATLGEVEALEMKKMMGFTSWSKEDLYSAKEQKRFIVTKDSKEMDGSIVKYRIYYLLQQKNGIVHCVQLHIRDNFIQNHPEKQTVIKTILDSFI